MKLIWKYFKCVDCKKNLDQGNFSREMEDINIYKLGSEMNEYVCLKCYNKA